MTNKTIQWMGAMGVILTVGNANAFTYDRGRTAVKLTGYATPGLIQPDFSDGKFIADWRARAQFNYAVAQGQSLGAVYAIDALATDEGYWARDAFMFFEMARYGRIELGLTDSIAKKLGVGLPDVGGLRINDQSLIFKKIRPDGPIISDLTINDGRYSPRLNLASMPRNGIQFGTSLATSEHFDFSADAAIKIRQPYGRIKTAFTLGASFIDNPHNLRVGSGTQNLDADWRAQGSAGINIQYKGWIFGAGGRIVYDKNALGRPSDGVAAGAGLSYDLLKYTVSATYLFSDTGIWGNAHHYIDHTAIASLRYKYSKNVDGWVSLGLSTETPFLAAGIRVNF